MTAPFLIRGDALPALAPLSETPDEDDSPAMLWGVDLSACATRKQAKAAWHHALAALKSQLDEAPRVRRVCIACLRPSGFARQAPIRVPERIATQLHNDLERDRARYVSTLVVDVTECDDPALLRTRLGAALTESTRWGDLTLEWQDIADCTVHEAWAREAL
ncbi:hypothetical protein [Leucobacter triazinivorans]|uniref:Uncharacterized protein n=1 Tax=Leucobacter triazinivorans TaxID=1784719 RepID=A0A4P6KGM7_9MICO|nr:hypothetical protein [Leucobacter triazinivorans]QBE49231.1 hypothetical protein EVS81_10605 [Leucobacter triazinivorans]